MIPCSYRASSCLADLPSCTAFYTVSVRQTRGLPVDYPHIRLPSDSTSRWTPLPSAISFPLPGGFGTCTLKKRAPPGTPKSAQEIMLCFLSALYSYLKDLLLRCMPPCSPECRPDSVLLPESFRCHLRRCIFTQSLPIISSGYHLNNKEKSVLLYLQNAFVFNNNI